MDKKESEQSKLYVYMMGTCSLIYEEKQIALKLNNSKVTRLLLVLLYAGDKGVSRSALLEMLYGREDRSNPSNSLRALVFRLRKLLVEAGLPDGDYISTDGGIYRWAGVIPLWVDVHEFKQLAAQALKEPSEEERYLLLQKTSKIYRGGGTS